ncbi:MAG: molybdopterin biosynthesis protein [Desulfitobacteriaceae bacterium]|nr:molybdopterin biosynthesis protein [Desulfitobacteriaceae bacterium]
MISVAKRSVYLDNLPVEDAHERYWEFLNKKSIKGKTEVVPVSLAAGRITAEAVYALVSSPHYHASAMDGVAVRAEDTYGASETTPIWLKINEQAIEVDTGDPVPQGFDAIIMVENLHYPDEDTVEIIQPVAPWQHVRTVGEDMVVGEMIVPARHRLSPVDIGALLAGGVLNVNVYSRVRVAILPTGTELVSPGSELKPGDIIEYNGAMLAAAVRSWGAEAQVLGMTVDDYDLLKEKIKAAAADFDVVVVNAGSSAGREDFTTDIIRELGEVVVHGVAIKPGKPVILGAIGETPVVGIPGYPVSAYFTLDLFVKPLVYRLGGTDLPVPRKIKALTAKKIVSPLGQEEFMRVKLGKIGGKVIATPISRGAGIVTSLVKADGILRVPRLSEGYHAGQEVDVELMRESERVERTLVITGSHDMCLDIIRNHLEKKGLAYLSSAHVGSTGGLMAIRRGEAHAAGIHLLDPKTGEYNVSYIKKYLPEKRVVLFNLVYRQQGIIVSKGNPKNIKGITDISCPGITFVNRQAGAGTRVLFDYQLQQLGIQPTDIDGYRREEFTHLAVAVAITSGTADCGMGILAAAQAMDLDFIPIAEERYDLLVDAEYWDSELVRSLREVISIKGFLEEVEGLGGYSTRDTGKIMWRN